MSILTYNNVTLQLIKTNSITRIPRLSDDGTEYMWTDFIIDVRCIYNPAATAYNVYGTPSPGSLPMTTDVGIRSLLLQKRCPLYFAEGGITILNIESNAFGGLAVDADNGPTPIDCTVTRIGSARIFEVNYTVKASIVECLSGVLISPIASSRYSRTEDIDQDFISALTTGGTTYFRSNVLLANGTVADFYRAYIIPPVLLGYKRERINFMIKSDGTSISWYSVDVEQKQELGSPTAPGTAASYGITQMGMTYNTSVLSNGPNGLASYNSIASVTAWAKGQRFADRYGMLQFIIRVAYQKLANVSPIGFVVGGEISEDIFDNRVQMSISYLVLDDGDGDPELLVPIIRTVGNQILLPSLPNNTGQNPAPPFSKGTRGTAGYELAVAGFAAACISSLGSDITGLTLDPNLYVSATPYGNGPVVQAFPDPGIPLPAIPSPSLRQSGRQNRYGGNKAASLTKKWSSKASTVNTSGAINMPKASSGQTSTSPGNGGSSGNGGSTSGIVSSGASSGSTGSPTPTPTPTNSNTSVNIQLFQPTAKKIVEWSTEKIGAPCELPDPTVPQSFQSNFFLLSATVSPQALEVMADGYTLIYRCSGVYVYSILNPGQIQTLGYDIPPWLNIESSEFTEVVASDFESGIINNDQV